MTRKWILLTAILMLSSALAQDEVPSPAPPRQTNLHDIDTLRKIIEEQEEQLRQQRMLNEQQQLKQQQENGFKYEELICPISQEIMEDPVITADGHTYDRASISIWLQNHNTSPITGLPLRDKVLIPNISLRYLIREYVQRNGHRTVLSQVELTPRQQQHALPQTFDTTNNNNSQYRPTESALNTTQAPKLSMGGHVSQFFQGAGKQAVRAGKFAKNVVVGVAGFSAEFSKILVRDMVIDFSYQLSGFLVDQLTLKLFNRTFSSRPVYRFYNFY